MSDFAVRSQVLLVSSNSAEVLWVPELPAHEDLKATLTAGCVKL